MSENLSGLGNEIPTFTDAWRWCMKHFVTIIIKPEMASTDPRVEVRAPGYNIVERNTLEECIADIENYRRVHRV